jgi:hypothetical protein
MNGKADDKAEKLMNAYYDYIGDQHLENICRDIEAREEEISRTKVPESLDGWFAQFITQYKQKQATRFFFNRLKIVSTKVAAVLFVLVASMLIVTLSVDAIRMKVFNLLLESNDTYSSVRVEEKTEVSIEWEEYYFPAWLPEGFRFGFANELKNVKIIEFTNDKNQFILFSQAMNGTELQINTEDGRQTTVEVNQQPAILSEKPGENILFWNNDEFSFCLSSEMDGVILIKIAESMKKK